MKTEELVKLRDGLKELVDLLNDILLIEDDEDNEGLRAQKMAMFIYKLLLLKGQLK